MRFKRKKITVGKTSVIILAPTTESGRVQDIFFDFNLKVQLAKKYFNPSYHHSAECERFFKNYKKELEKKYPNSLVVISYPTSWLAGKLTPSDVSFSIRLVEKIQDSAPEIIKASLPIIEQISSEIISEINSIFELDAHP